MVPLPCSCQEEREEKKKKIQKREKKGEKRKRKEEKRKDYAFRHQFGWNPSIIQGCPGPACVTLASPLVCESIDKMAGEQVSLALSNVIVMSVCLPGCPSGYQHVCLLACLSVCLSACLAATTSSP